MPHFSEWVTWTGWGVEMWEFPLQLWETAGQWLDAGWGYIGLTLQEIVQSVSVRIVGTIVIALLAWFFGPRMWRRLHRRLKAMMLRRYNGQRFAIAVCDMAGDENGTLRNMIRSNVEDNYEDYAGVDLSRELHVFEFPLSIDSGEPEVGQGKTLALARKWLKRTGSDVIVWGEALDALNSGKTGKIRFLGASMSDKEVRKVEVDFGGHEKGRFNETIAEAVTIEIAAAKEKVYGQPETIRVDILRRISDKASPLIESEMPGLKPESRDSIRRHFDEFQLELSRRATHVEDWDRAIENARRRLAHFDEQKDPAGWADAALRLAIHIRRRSWAGCPVALTEEGYGLSVRAGDILKTQGAVEMAREAAVERGWLARCLQDTAPQDTSDARPQQAIDNLLNLAPTEDADAADDFHQQLLAGMLLDNIGFFVDFINLGPISSSWPRQAWERIGGLSLETAKAERVALDISRAVFREGDRTGDQELWRAAIKFLDHVKANVSDRPLLRACIEVAHARAVATAYSTVNRLGGTVGTDEQTAILRTAKEAAVAAGAVIAATGAAPQLEAQMSETLSRALGIFAQKEKNEELFQTAVDYGERALAIAKGMYPALVEHLTEQLAVVKNNWSYSLRATEPAREAIVLLSSQEGEMAPSAAYVFAYSHWVLADVLLDRHGDRSTEDEMLKECVGLLEKARKLAKETASRTEEALWLASIRELLEAISKTEEKLSLSTEAVRQDMAEDNPKADPPVRYSFSYHPAWTRPGDP